MHVAVDSHEAFPRPLLSAIGGSRVVANNYYTQECAALISHCISLGILQPDKAEEPEIDEWDS